jgi:hypothetical protein
MVKPRLIPMPVYPLSSFIFLLLYLSLFIDSVNGVILRAGLPSISIAYKTFILFLILIHLRKVKNTYYPVAILGFYFIIHSLMFKDIFFTLSGLDWLIKFFSIYWFYLFFKSEIEKNRNHKIFNLGIAFFIVLGVNIALGLLGFGYAQYTSADIGVRGYIYAGNEVAVTLVATMSILLIKNIESGNIKLYLVYLFAFFFLAVFQATKVSIISALYISLLFPLVKASQNINHLKISNKSLGLVFFTFIIIPLIGTYAIYFILFEVGLWQRISYFYYSVGWDIPTLIFSSRNIWAKEALNGFLEYNFIEVLFGSGKAWVDLLSTIDKGSVEIDIIDFLMRYGIIGVFLSYGFFIFFFKKSHQVNVDYHYRSYVLLTIVLLIAISFFAGHVLYSGTAAPVLAALLAMSHIQSIRN